MCMYKYTLYIIILKLLVPLLLSIFPPVVGRRRAIKMLFFRGITSPQLDAIRPGRPRIRHHHSQ